MAFESLRARFAVAYACLSPVLLACGTSPATTLGSAPDPGSDPAPLDAGRTSAGGEGGDAGPRVAPVTAGPGCSLAIRGGDDETPTCAECGAMLANGSLTLSMMCRDAVHDYMAFEVTVPVDASTRTGTLASSSFDFEVVAEGDGSYDALSIYQGNPQASACAVALDAFDPAARSGLAARFDCPGLMAADDPGKTATVDVTGAMVLPAGRATIDAGATIAPNDADGGAESDASRCTLEVRGAYATARIPGHAYALPGVPAFVECSATADGIAYAANLQGWSLVNGDTWCAAGCDSEYVAPSAGACTSTTIRDDGFPGGRWVGSFACEGLVAPDGTQMSTAVTVDAVLSEEPQ